ncbi:hypothetical protein ACFYPJ_31535, partial [Streptomyces sp. NPDC006012]
ETDDPSAARIRALYTSQNGAPPLVQHGQLPKKRRKGSPEDERQARQRMYNLLKPEYRASPAEEKVLRDAGIPLLPRVDGGYHIDPQVEREADEDSAQAGAERAFDIAKLYGLAPGFPALVEHGILPELRKKGVPKWEQKIRLRLQDLLKPDKRASPAEEKVLRDAGIPLLPRKGGGYHVDPKRVKREGNRKKAAISGVSALPPSQQPPVPAPACSPPTTAAHTWPAHPAIHTDAQVWDWQNQNWYPEQSVSMPTGAMPVSGFEPAETLPVLPQGMPLHLSFQQPVSEYPVTGDWNTVYYNGEPGPSHVGSSLPTGTMPSWTDGHTYPVPAGPGAAAMQYQPFPPGWTAPPQPTTTYPDPAHRPPPRPARHHQPKKKKH